MTLGSGKVGALCPHDLRGGTLEILTGEKQPQSNLDTYVVMNVRRLWSIPIGAFTVEDLRIVIGQRICLPWLFPIAIEKLEANPLLEARHYEGDLLASMLLAAEQADTVSGGDLTRLAALCRRARHMIQEIEDRQVPVDPDDPFNASTKTFDPDLVNVLDRFLAR